MVRGLHLSNPPFLLLAIFLTLSLRVSVTTAKASLIRDLVDPTASNDFSCKRKIPQVKLVDGQECPSVRPFVLSFWVSVLFEVVSASLIALDMGSATFLPCFILNPTEYLFFPLTCRLLTKMEGKKGEGRCFRMLSWQGIGELFQMVWNAILVEGEKKIESRERKKGQIG